MSRRPFLVVDGGLADATVGDRVPIAGDQRHHLATVLRLADGDTVDVTDGRGAKAVAMLRAGGLELTTVPEHHDAPAPTVTVVQALPKGRKLDDIVRVLTELGVDRVELVEAQRSLVKIDRDRASTLLSRLEAVERSASMQAQRVHRLHISPPGTLTAQLAASRTLAIAHPAKDSRWPAQRLDHLAAATPSTDIAIAIGPEGGWVDEEVSMMVAAGGVVVALGPTIVRTEHAGAAAAAVALAALGRWSPAAG